MNYCTSFHVVIVVCSIYVINCTIRTRTFLKEIDKRCTGIRESFSATSEVDCSRTCLEKEECSLASYNPSLKICELSQVQTDLTTAIVSEMGWNVYHKLVADPECLPDWTAFENSCYYLDTQQRTFPEAQTYCSSLHAHLVDIKTSEESTFITDWLLQINPGNPVWIDGIYDTSTGQYYLNDGTPFSSGPSSWGPGEPTHMEEHCVAAHPVIDFLWADVQCALNMLTMCEYSLI